MQKRFLEGNAVLLLVGEVLGIEQIAAGCARPGSADVAGIADPALAPADVRLLEIDVPPEITEAR